MKFWRAPTAYIINHIIKGENIVHIFGKYWYWKDGKTIIKGDKTLKQVHPVILERYKNFTK